MNTQLYAASTFGGETLNLSTQSLDTELRQTTSHTQHHEHLTELLSPEVTIPVALAAGAVATYAITELRRRRMPIEKQLAKETQETAETERNKIAERRITHHGHELVLNGIFGDAAIEASPVVDEIEVILTGKEKRLDALRISPGQEALQVSAVRSAVYLQIETMSSLSSMLKKLAKVLNFELVDKTDKVNIVAKVPEGSALTLKSVDGSIQANGTYGDAKIDVRYSRSATVEKTAAATINADSSSKVQVGAVNGPVRISAGYNSTVVVGGGNASSLKANLDSSSRLSFLGEAHGLSLKTAYNSKAEIQRASGRVAIECDSNSRAEVEGGNATAVRLKGSYNSRVAYKGQALEADIDLDSSCHGKLGSAKKLVARVGYNSTTNVISGDVDRANIHADSSSRLYIDGVVHSGRIVAGYNSLVQAAGFGRNVRYSADSSSRIRVK